MTSAIGVLERLGDPAVRDAVEVFRALRAGEALSPKMIRSIETDLLVRNMSPKLRDEGVDANETRTLREAATSMFRVNAPLPTRQNVQRAYREFEAARPMTATSLNTPAKSGIYHYPEMTALNARLPA